MVPYSPWDSPEEEGRYTWQPTPAIQPPQSLSGPPWTAANPPPSGSAPPGTNWMLNPNTGEFEPVPNGQMPPWGPRADQPGSPTPPASTPPPGPTMNTTEGPTGGPTDGWGYLTEPFSRTPPQWMSGPGFVPPQFTPPPDFAYREFAAPSEDSIYTDPSFQFREKQGRQALEQSAAARGILRTGGTLKDLINYGQNAASQEYSNIFDRAAQSHNMGLQQALGTYATNYGVDRDVYDRLYQGNKASFDAQARDNEMMNQRNFDSFLADFDIFDRNRKRAAEMLFGGAGLGG